eukprot:9491916-Pyramimonas_sp.AAC.1
MGVGVASDVQWPCVQAPEVRYPACIGAGDVLFRFLPVVYGPPVRQSGGGSHGMLVPPPLVLEAEARGVRHVTVSYAVALAARTLPDERVLVGVALRGAPLVGYPIRAIPSVARDVLGQVRLEQIAILRAAEVEGVLFRATGDDVVVCRGAVYRSYRVWVHAVVRYDVNAAEHQPAAPEMFEVHIRGSDGHDMREQKQGICKNRRERSDQRHFAPLLVRERHRCFKQALSVAPSSCVRSAALFQDVSHTRRYHGKVVQVVQVVKVTLKVKVKGKGKHPFH